MPPATAQTAFARLPAGVAAAAFARLPLVERVAAVPLVCRELRVWCAGPDAPYDDFEWTVHSFEQLAGLLRWLAARALSLQRLHLTITIRSWRKARTSPGRPPASPRSCCQAAAAQLATVLAQARHLQELSLTLNACNGHERAAQWLQLPPLPSGALPHLRRLELASGCRVALPASLGQLSGLRELKLSGTLLEAGAKLPPGLTRLQLAGPKAIDSAAGHPGWAADHLPQLCCLELTAPAEEDGWWGEGQEGWEAAAADAAALGVNGWRQAGEPLKRPPGRAEAACQRLLAVWADPLADKLQQLAAVGSPPPALGAARFGALRALSIADVDPAELAAATSAGSDGHEGWDALERLSNLASVHLQLMPHQHRPPPATPLTLPGMPRGLEELAVEWEGPGAACHLPWGAFLRSLRRLALPAPAALRLPPLLRHMPQLEHLTIVSGCHTAASNSHSKTSNKTMQEGHPPRGASSPPSTGATPSSNADDTLQEAADALAAALARLGKAGRLRIAQAAAAFKPA